MVCFNYYNMTKTITEILTSLVDVFTYFSEITGYDIAQMRAMQNAVTDSSV